MCPTTWILRPGSEFKKLGDFCYGRGRFWFNVGLSGVEVDAVDRGVARCPDVIGKDFRIGNHVLGHGFFLDDGEPVLAGKFGPHFNPDFLAVLVQLVDLPFVICRADECSTELLDGILEVATDLEFAWFRFEITLRVVGEPPELSLDMDELIGFPFSTILKSRPSNCF